MLESQHQLVSLHAIVILPTDSSYKFSDVFRTLKAIFKSFFDVQQNFFTYKILLHTFMKLFSLLFSFYSDQAVPTRGESF